MIMPYVYVLCCADESYYTGWTADLEKRLAMHNTGKASKYTRSRRPVSLVYAEELPNKSEALKREHQIKKMQRSDKERLIQSKEKPASGEMPV